MSVRYGIVALLAAALFGATARAELVATDVNTFRALTFVEGVSLESSTFQVTQGGSYTVSLVDYAFPQTFENLTVAITDAAASFFVAQVRAGVDPGDIVLDTAGTYVASVFAEVTGGGTGLFELTITPNEMDVVIPVPAAAWLLASALLVLGARVRRR